eukprot:131180-Prymnesium_polylepis.1
MVCRLAEGRLVHECDRRAAAWDVPGMRAALQARVDSHRHSASVGAGGCPMHRRDPGTPFLRGNRSMGARVRPGSAYGGNVAGALARPAARPRAERME